MEQTTSVRRVLGEVAFYFGSTLLCLFFLTGVLKLWRGADLNVPFAYDADSLLTHSWIKGMMENGSQFHNQYLAAPQGADLYDFPTAESFHFGVMKGLSLLGVNSAAVYNLYFLLTFPLTTLTSLCVLRHLGVGRLASMLASLLFTFLPYHFLRGQAHLFLAAYYLIPPIVLVVLWIWAGDRILFVRSPEESSRTRFRLFTVSSLLAIVICALTASAGIYYAFFACYFLLIAGLSAAFTQRKFYPLGNALILVAIISIGVLANVAPNLLYIHEHGSNPAAVVRVPLLTELYGMKIVQLVLPITWHRIRWLADFKANYNAGNFLVNENDISSLGLFASVGFLFLIARLLYRRRTETRSELIDNLSVLNVFAILLATVGGLGTVFGVSVTSWIRCYNRMSIFIGFFSLVAVAVLVNQLLQRWNVFIRTRMLFVAVCLCVAAGVYDQTSYRYGPIYAAVQKDYHDDGDFVSRIEASLPEHAMVFQLPYSEYPEGPMMVHRLKVYDHLRGYLHSRTLRWSYGAMKGREGDAWQKTVTALPVDEMCGKLAEAGFAGIYVDRFGFADMGADIESKLTASLGPPTVVSKNDRLSFFELGKYRGRKLPPEHQTATR
jgi:hypothetical protein